MKIYGTTISIGKKKLKTCYGEFDAYTFQDVIDRKYISALCFGDLKKT